MPLHILYICAYISLSYSQDILIINSFTCAYVLMESIILQNCYSGSLHDNIATMSVPIRPTNSAVIANLPLRL